MLLSPAMKVRAMLLLAALLLVLSLLTLATREGERESIYSCQ